MKKVVLIPLIFCFVLTDIKAQLANSKFKGVIQMESLTDIIWSFEKDTVRVYTMADSSMIETMVYKLDHNILSLSKAYGTSSCTVVGKYKIDLNGDNLTFSLVEDACNDRADAINGKSFSKIK